MTRDTTGTVALSDTTLADIFLIGATTMLFSSYRTALLDAQSIHDPRLLIASEGRLTIRYAPFDFVNQKAKVVLLGITPGAQQADAAIGEARRALRAGLSDADILARAKVHASFAGAMRANLIDMLDAVGLAQALDLVSCASLWGQDTDRVHFASALRYPVFLDGGNYAGRSPEMTRSEVLRDHLRRYTTKELASIPDALVLPLGPAVADACAWLIEQGLLEASRVAIGLPHPSPASNERIAFFLGRKDEARLSRMVNPSKIVEGRKAVTAAIQNWAGRCTLA